MTDDTSSPVPWSSAAARSASPRAAGQPARGRVLLADDLADRGRSGGFAGPEEHRG